MDENCLCLCILLAERVSITHQDSRWVGAWWLGYVVAGSLTLLAALPFWFLPRALPETPQTPDVDQPSNHHQHTSSVTEIAKGTVCQPYPDHKS